jgi:hypothetical protein
MQQEFTTTLTPAEFMLTCDMSHPDVEIYHMLMDSILTQLTKLCDEEKDLTRFREGVIDVLITFDTQPTEH